MFGLPSVGDPYIDSQFHNQLVDVMITINDMVEYYRKGVTVRITVHEDTKTIYEIIKNYLISWNQKLLNGINIGVAPIDDLVLLDKFASAIYPHAKSHFKAEDALKQLMGSMGNSSSSWLGRNSVNQQELAPEQVPEKHESMAQILSEKIIGRNRPTEISGDRQPQIFKSKW